MSRKGKLLSLIHILGTLKNDKFREDGTISSSGGFTAKMVRGEVIRITDSMSQKEAEDLAYSLRRTGFDASCGYLGNDDWTVYVQNSSRSEVESASKKSAERISSFNGICLSGGGENLLMVSNDVDLSLIHILAHLKQKTRLRKQVSYCCSIPKALTSVMKKLIWYSVSLVSATNTWICWQKSVQSLKKKKIWIN